MAERVRASKTKAAAKKAAEELASTKTTEKEKTEQELKDELDALLESIDEALGENIECAQDFVNSYLQKGGQAARVFLNTVREGFNVTFLPALFKMRFLP